MKKLFVLSGSSNAGKTTTLNKLANACLMQHGAVMGIGINLPHGDDNDDQYCFDIRICNMGVRVGIFTAGDTPDAIQSGFEFFINNKCDVCFIAAKSYGSTIDQIERLANINCIVPIYFHMIWMNHYSPRSRDQIQKDIVKQLVAMI